MMIKICGNPCHTFTRDEIPVDNDDITKPGQLKQWKYLEPVVNQLNFERKYICWTTQKRKLLPIQVLQGRNGGPMHLEQG